MVRKTKSAKAPVLVGAASKATKDAPTPAAGPIEFDTDPLGFLVAPETKATFMSKVWEQGPAVYKANAAKRLLLEGTLSAGAFLDTLDTQEEAGMMLTWGMDVNAVRYVNSEREVCHAEGHGVVDRDSAKEHMADGCTLQVHHPQRFDDVAWRLCAALEQQLGCLVGCNAYITPAGSQGLAPHHDDVELWVCQTQGTKKWRVYKPLEGRELPGESSPDLPREMIGDPILEVTLTPGDVLYLPRGTIHEAEAQTESSSHLTLSSYQKWNWHEFMMRTVEISAAGTTMPRSMRRGLPQGFVYNVGIQQALLNTLDPSLPLPPLVNAAYSLASAMRDMADAIEANPEVVEDAADELGRDFIQDRLPPYPSSIAPKGEVPTLTSQICCRIPGMCRLIEVDSDSESDGESDDDDEAGEGAQGAPVPSCCAAPDPKAPSSCCARTAAAKAAGAKADADGEADADKEGEDEDDSEGDEDAEPSFRHRLITSLHNQRETHMIDIGSGDEDDGTEAQLAQLRAELGDEDGSSESEEEMPPALVAIAAEATVAEAKKAEAAGEKASGRKASAGKVADPKDGDAAGDGDSDEDSVEDLEHLATDLKTVEEDLVGAGLAIPQGHAFAVATILSCVNGKSVRVRDLVLQGDEGDSAEQTKLLMVHALWNLGVVRVLEAKAEAKKEVKKEEGKKRKGDGAGAAGGAKKQKGSEGKGKKKA